MFGLVLKRTYDKLKRELNHQIYKTVKLEHERDVYQNIVETWVTSGREELVKLRESISEKT